MAYQQETLQDLLDALTAGWDGAPFWTDAQGTRYLNQALRWWNLLTGMWKRKVVVATPTPASSYITVPGTLTYGTQVVWGPSGVALDPSALWDLDCARPRWEEETTASGGTVPTAPQLWAPVGLSEIAVWPQDSAGGAPLLVDGIAATPVLVNLTDYVDMGAHDANAVVKLALHLGCFTRGAAAIAATAPYLSDFMMAAAEQNVRLKHASFYRKFMGLDQQKSFRPVVSIAQSPRQG